MTKSGEEVDTQVDPASKAPAEQPAAPRPIPFHPLLDDASDRGFDRAALKRLQHRCLGRLSPGIVHCMNNVLAVFSSHSQLQASRRSRRVNSAREQTGGGRELAALDRSIQVGRQAMVLVGDLSTFDDSHGLAKQFSNLGSAAELRPQDFESSAGPTCLGTLVRSLTDILLCESGSTRYPVDLDLGLQIYSSLARGPLVLIVTLLTEQVLMEIPQDLNGSIAIRTCTLRSAGTETLQSRIEIRVGFSPARGQLPFPIPAQMVDSDLRNFFRKLDISLSRADRNCEYRVELPGAVQFRSS